MHGGFQLHLDIQEGQEQVVETTVTREVTLVLFAHQQCHNPS